MIKIFLVTISVYSLNDNALVWDLNKSPEVNIEVCKLHAHQKNMLPAQPPAYVTMSNCEVNVYNH